MRPPVTVDPAFDAAVEADLTGRANDAQVAMLEADPGAWRRALSVRRTDLQAQLREAKQAADSPVEVVRGPGRVAVVENVGLAPRAGHLRRRLEQLETRAQRAKLLNQESETTNAIRRSQFLSGLVGAATVLVPEDTPDGARWHAAVRAFVEEEREGVAFTVPSRWYGEAKAS